MAAFSGIARSTHAGLRRKFPRYRLTRSLDRRPRDPGAAHYPRTGCLEQIPRICAGNSRSVAASFIAAIPLLRDGARRSVPSRCTAGILASFSDSADGIAENLRRAGGDRDHQRRDLSRVANPHRRSPGIPGIPDRDQRRAEGHQPLDVRSATGAGYGGRDRCTALRRRSGCDRPPRGRLMAVGSEFWISTGIRGIPKVARGISARPRRAECRSKDRAGEGPRAYSRCGCRSGLSRICDQAW